MTISAQTHICFQNQWKVGSPFQISILCDIKRFHFLVLHHHATCLSMRLLSLRIWKRWRESGAHLNLLGENQL